MDISNLFSNNLPPQEKFNKKYIDIITEVSEDAITIFSDRDDLTDTELSIEFKKHVDEIITKKFRILPEDQEMFVDTYNKIVGMDINKLRNIRKNH